MFKRTLILAVTGFAFGVAACGSYGTSVVEGNKAPARVASVSLTVPLSLITGQTTRAVAIPKDATGAALSGRPISWFTSSASIASVTDSGLISAVAPGSAVVSAVSEGVSGQATIGVMPPTPTPVATVTVVVSPPSVLVGQTAVATATLKDSTGAPIVGRLITWQTSNSSVAAVAQTGNVTAVAPGTAMISALSEGKSASSALSVSAPPPVPVASVSVSPATATVQVGSTQQLAAVTYDVSGTQLNGRVVTWTSSNPSIAAVNSSGLVTALVAGPATVTATSETKTATATITVTTAPPPPPPPPTGLWRANEPAGMTTISDRPFSALNEMGWADGGGSGEFGFTTDAAAPQSPPGVLHAWWPTGYAAGGGPVGMSKTFSPYRTIYITYWAKLSANFYGQGVADKEFYMYTSTLVSTPYFATVGPGTNPLVPQVRDQGSVHWTPNYPDGNHAPNLVPTARIPRGQWYLVEAVFVGNTAGKEDGTVDWFINGVHVGSYTVQWESGNVTWVRCHLTTIWGGLGGTVPATMDMWWDHVYLSGK